MLDAQDDKLLLLSRYGLDAQPYNMKNESVTWKCCTLRTWLNETFINAAFSSEEQQCILLTDVKNVDRYTYGCNTQDKVFLLSYEEAGKYFASDDARMCAPTDYAVAQGASQHGDYKVGDGLYICLWWLRSPGSGLHMCYVDSKGSKHSVLHNGGFRSNYYRYCVRPALWVDLQALE